MMDCLNEIGSEYSTCEAENSTGILLPFDSERNCVYSGRTAIETVLKEVPHAKKALLPSYCCESMIIPFQRAGIRVEFYPVFYDADMQYQIEVPPDVDVFVWCNYFGFVNEMPELSSFINRGGIIIEDITHSMLSQKQFHAQSDYLVASLRKWEPIFCGGYCAATKGGLHHIPDVKPPEDFVATKKKAMELKTEYLCDHDEEKKAEYLRLFSESNAWLAERYSGLSIDSWSKQYLTSVDTETQIRIRRNNAHVLYQELKDIVDFMFPESQMDCPLFVPILLPNDRNRIRSGLTSRAIYCPIHWPKPKQCESNLYDMELSLVCDQRYNEEDMERIVSVLKCLV